MYILSLIYVLLRGVTYNLVKDKVRANTLGSIKVKQEEVKVYEVGGLIND